MGGRSAAGPVLDEHYTQTFAGHVRQLLIEDERDLRILADVFLSRDACGEKCGAAAINNAILFMEPSPLVGGCGIRLRPGVSI